MREYRKRFAKKNTNQINFAKIYVIFNNFADAEMAVVQVLLNRYPE